MNVKEATLALSAQMSELLSQMDKKAFCQPLVTFHGQSIGQHFRHILEFYTCLLDGAQIAYVDYTNRERKKLVAENPSVAIATLDAICKHVWKQDEKQWLKVISEFSSETPGEKAWHLSSMSRELQYAYEHAMHHLAIIRIGLEIHFPQLYVPKDLGVAPSTLRFRAKEEQVLGALAEEIF